MKKVVITFIVALLLGLVAGKFLLPNGSNKKTEEQANVILEKITEVNKLISVEGSFGEVYTLKETQKLFFDMIPVSKKAIVVANAKAYIAHDLSEMEFELDKENKRVLLKNIPEPDIIIEPDLKFYDLQAYLIPFSESELTQLNKRAIELLREKAKTEGLIQLANKNLELNLEKIMVVAEEQGWEVEIFRPQL